MKQKAKEALTCLLNSYSQIFFSDDRLFAVLLLIVSFADVYAGLAGLISVLTTNYAGVIIGFDRATIRKGIFGFNSLLVGLCLGIFFSPGVLLYIIVILASLLTLFISVSMQGVIGKYGLPFLSVPFLIGAWIVTLATRNMSFLGISERGIFTLNEIFTFGGHRLVNIYEWWNGLEMVQPLKIYFISLGAILFQYNVLSGIIIAAGLLLYSRISFSLSLVGFFTAYLFYDFAGADISEMNYSYIGFNYILTSIALGGFFLIPSWRSYLWSVILVPVVALITLGLYSLFSQISLPLFALPFNLVVLLFLYTLKFRVKYSYKLSEVIVQQNSPEKNLYSFQNDTGRFRHDMIPLHLPFFGTWTVAQGYNGSETHLGEWKYALDFIISDTAGKQFSGKGDVPEEYYCFDKPVLAPSDGYVESVLNDVDDNIIGKVNVKENWGNTVIIRHNNFLFSSLSHLRKNSITVKAGDRVKQGDIIGKCGNSGRSPYPHLHFQMQAHPFIGSPTISYPVSYFIKHSGGNYSLDNYKVPETGHMVSNVEKNEALSAGFDFIPGRSICMEADFEGGKKKEIWEVKTNEFNQTFISCDSTGSAAYFTNDGSLFLFRHYDGPKDTLLYYFFLAAFRIQFGFYSNIEISDSFPLNLIFKNPLLFIQDFFAPFFRFLRSDFKIKYEYIDNEVFTTRIILASSAENYFAGRLISKISFKIILTGTGIAGFEINEAGKLINVRICTEL